MISGSRTWLAPLRNILWGVYARGVAGHPSCAGAGGAYGRQLAARGADRARRADRGDQAQGRSQIERFQGVSAVSLGVVAWRAVARMGYCGGNRGFFGPRRLMGHLTGARRGLGMAAAAAPAGGGATPLAPARAHPAGRRAGQSRPMAVLRLTDPCASHGKFRLRLSGSGVREACTAQRGAAGSGGNLSAEATGRGASAASVRDRVERATVSAGGGDVKRAL